jgi:hypothetical protein
MGIFNRAGTVYSAKALDVSTIFMLEKEGRWTTDNEICYERVISFYGPVCYGRVP